MLRLVDSLRAGVAKRKLQKQNRNPNQKQDLKKVYRTKEENGIDAKDESMEKKKNEEDGEEDKGLWINLTTGSWASPFWLLWVNSIWRGGGDLGKAKGPKDGSTRELWMSYRDGVLQERQVE